MEKKIKLMSVFVLFLMVSGLVFVSSVKAFGDMPNNSPVATSANVPVPTHSRVTATGNMTPKRVIAQRFNNSKLRSINNNSKLRKAKSVLYERLLRFKKRVNPIVFKKINTTLSRLNDTQRRILGKLDSKRALQLMEGGRDKVRNFLKNHKILDKKELERIYRVKRDEMHERMLVNSINALNRKIHEEQLELLRDRAKLRVRLHKGNLSQQISDVKNYLNKTVSLLEHWLEAKKVKVESLQTVDQATINKSVSIINQQIETLNELSSKIQNATTKDQLKAINRNLVSEWHRYWNVNNELSVNVEMRKVGEYIVRANVLESRLNNALDAAQNKSIDTSFVDNDVSKFNTYINESQKYYTQAQQLLNSTNASDRKRIYSQVRDLLGKSKRALWNANKLVVKIVRELNKKRVSLKFNSNVPVVVNHKVLSYLNQSRINLVPTGEASTSVENNSGNSGSNETNVSNNSPVSGGSTNSNSEANVSNSSINAGINASSNVNVSA